MEVLAMVDRVDLLIAVIGIVVSILGSSTALWMAVSKKADREDLVRLEAKLDSGINRLDAKLDSGISRLDAKLDSGISRLDAKLDALVLRLLPEQLPHPEN
jgi:hypothetical protein